MPSYAAQGSRKPATDSREAQTFQLCREVVLDLTRCKAVEDFYKQQIAELKAANGNLEEQNRLKDSAIANYNKAIESRTAAEARVTEIRANYEAQMKITETQLAAEQGKVAFWKRVAAFGTFVGIAIGAAAAVALKGN